MGRMRPYEWIANSRDYKHTWDYKYMRRDPDACLSCIGRRWLFPLAVGAFVPLPRPVRQTPDGELLLSLWCNKKSLNRLCISRCRTKRPTDELLIV